MTEPLNFDEIERRIDAEHGKPDGGCFLAQEIVPDLVAELRAARAEIDKLRSAPLCGDHAIAWYTARPTIGPVDGWCLWCDLVKQVERAEGERDGIRNYVGVITRSRDAAEARIEELTTALRPFADAASYINADIQDRGSFATLYDDPRPKLDLRYGDFRRAARAIAGPTPAAEKCGPHIVYCPACRPISDPIPTPTEIDTMDDRGGDGLDVDTAATSPPNAWGPKPGDIVRIRDGKVWGWERGRVRSFGNHHEHGPQTVVVVILDFPEATTNPATGWAHLSDIVPVAEPASAAREGACGTCKGEGKVIASWEVIHAPPAPMMNLKTYKPCPSCRPTTAEEGR